MNIYTKEIDGHVVRKPMNKIVIKTDNLQIFNPTHETLLEYGWELYIEPVPTTEELLNEAKMIKRAEIMRYDKSKAVNNCYIVSGDLEIPYWSEKDERNDLKRAILDYKNKGHETYRLDLRDLGMSLTFPCDALLDMLSELEVYAIDCYNVTSDHLFAVNKLQTVAEVETYDYTTGYPEQLNFKI